MSGEYGQLQTFQRRGPDIWELGNDDIRYTSALIAAIILIYLISHDTRSVVGLEQVKILSGREYSSDNEYPAILRGQIWYQSLDRTRIFDTK